MRCWVSPLLIAAGLLSVVLLIGGCFAPANDKSIIYACVTTPVNPIRLESQHDAPVVGLVFYGTRLPITGRMSNCEWLKVEMPPTLRHLGAEGWIIGPPEFALLDGGGCADIPDLAPIPTPAG